MSFQVRVMYDFAGEPNTSELSITSGEILTVTREDVGEGWWEGINNVGQSGLFPETYVEKIDAKAPQASLPTLPPTPFDAPASYDTASQRYSNVGDSDSDWDNDTPSTYGQENQENIYSNIDERRHNDGTASEYNFDGKNSTGPRKGLNRFTSFVKMMGESYILGELKAIIPPNQKIMISHVNDLYNWPSIQNAYAVDIASPKKETKLKGLKSYIAYQLTPSFNNIKVSRRYKHFDWLHERLAEKFSIIAVPPLPDKQISGRYEDQFIEHRRLQLQEFINYVCKHPILSTSEVWQHFLTTTDEKQWKIGKRQAERDPLIGANFCLCITAPDKELLPSYFEPKIDSTFTFIQNLDAAIKYLMATSSDQAKKSISLYKKEYLKIGDAFRKMGFTLSPEDKATSPGLALGIVNVGDAYVDIGNLFDEQPRLDWEPLYNRMYLYKGLTSSFPDIMSLHRGTQQKKKECEKSVTITELTDIRRRADVLTYSIFAEMTHFKQQKDQDFKEAMETFLTEQITFYKKIVTRLETSLKKISEC